MTNAAFVLTKIKSSLFYMCGVYVIAFSTEIAM